MGVEANYVSLRMHYCPLQHRDENFPLHRARMVISGIDYWFHNIIRMIGCVCPPAVKVAEEHEVHSQLVAKVHSDLGQGLRQSPQNEKS